MHGATITCLELRRENLRFPFPGGFASAVQGRKILSLRRRAKYLLFDLDGGDTIIGHLGMSGSFRVESTSQTTTPGTYHHERSPAGKHDHVVFHLEGGHLDRTLVTYNDPRRFGFLLMAPTATLDQHPLIRDIGIEPLGNALSGPSLLSVYSGSLSPLKSALLDQKRIAGLGNIYVSEALWRSHLSPFRPAGSLQAPEADLLAASIRSVLMEALEAGGSSLRDHRQADGSLGYFQHRFSAYDRAGEPCRHAGCSARIIRDVQAGRSTFWCSACQK